MTRTPPLNALRTGAQNKRLWSLVGKLADHVGGREIAEGIMRDVCMEISGQTSTRKVSQAQADGLVERLEEAIKKAVAARAPDPDGTITKAQLKIIKHLFEDLGSFPTFEGRKGFSRRVCGRPWPQTVGDGVKLIEALHDMRLRQVDVKGMIADLCTGAQQCAPTSVQMTEWERAFVLDVQRQVAGGRKPTPGAVRKLVEVWGKYAAKPVGAAAASLSEVEGRGRPETGQNRTGQPRRVAPTNEVPHA